MREIRGKKALVTGAASGIGKAIALRLARDGADVCLLDADSVRLSAAVAEARELGVDAFGVTCDLASPPEISCAVQQVLQTWPRLEILVNNAGVAYRGRTEEMSAEQWDRLLAINLLAPIQLTRELLPTLLAQPQAHLMNVCSMLGLVAISKATAYCATKFGLVGFSDALRMEYRRTGLGVTALCPGFVRTGIFQSALGNGAGKLREPPRWMSVSPEAVAERAIKAIRQNRGTVLITPLAHVLWRLKRFAPDLLDVAGLLLRRPKPAAAAGASGQ